MDYRFAVRDGDEMVYLGKCSACGVVLAEVATKDDLGKMVRIR